ncbi:MAG: hypothetical protein ACLUNQ_00590 [Oscillospiraceae bacterium]
MVKGISRRVIVVESPDPRVFDQAIFILRNDVLGGGRRFFPAACGPGGAHRQELHPYPGPAAPKRHRLSPIIAAILGGGLMGLVWLAAAACRGCRKTRQGFSAG